MGSHDRNEKKHLYDPRKNGQTPGRFVPEFDPIFTADSWYQRASGGVQCTLGIVGTSRMLFCFGLIIQNVSTMDASITIFEGATVKIEKHVIGEDQIDIGYGNPRAPICRFNALEPVYVQSSPAAATCKVTMSWWDAEIR